MLKQFYFHTIEKKNTKTYICEKCLNIWTMATNKKWTKCYLPHTKAKKYQFPKNCKYYFVKKLCKINNTEIIEDINVTFHKGKKISISKKLYLLLYKEKYTK